MLVQLHPLRTTIRFSNTDLRRADGEPLGEDARLYLAGLVAWGFSAFGAGGGAGGWN